MAPIRFSHQTLQKQEGNTWGRGEGHAIQKPKQEILPFSWATFIKLFGWKNFRFAARLQTAQESLSLPPMNVAHNGGTSVRAEKLTLVPQY